MTLKICQIGQESFASDPKTTAGKRISSHLEGSVLGSAVAAVQKRFFSARCSGEHLTSKATQTDYRDSECQTLPWEPPYRVADGREPEVLTLLSFAWGDGLPAGVHEVELINRMRVRRAWERILPPMDTACNARKCSAIIAALEADEWAFREAEIQAVMDLRMELAAKWMEAKEIEKKRRAESRFERLEERLKKRRQKEAKNIKNELSRELRKLACKRRAAANGNARRHAKRDLIKTLADPRRRDASKRRDDSAGTEKSRPADELEHSTVDEEDEAKYPKWLFEKSNGSKRESSGICRRFAGKKEKHLLKLSQAFEEKREDRVGLSEEPCSLLKRKEKLPSLPPTPRLSWPSEHADDQIDQAVEYLQNLIDGRATQCEFYAKKNRMNDLVEELLASQKSPDEKLQIKLQRDEEERKVARENKAREIMQALEGKTVAKMLMFLNDELARLEGEKKRHALLLLAERERMRKKIERACQEQAELNRRRELDEIYRQVMKVNQESVQAYLEDVVKEGLDWASEREAETHVRELADKIDAMAQYMDDNLDKIDEEGLLADMVYNFVLPQVAKESDEQRRGSQESYLRAAHAAIYDETLGIAANELFAGTAAADASDQSPDAEDEELDVGGKVGSDDFLPQVIELILDYTPIADEDSKQEVYIILEEMLSIAKEKLTILN